MALAADRTRPALIAVVAGTVLFASPWEILRWSPSSRTYFTGTLLLPADLALLGVLIAAVPTIRASIRERSVGPGAIGWAAATAALLIAFPWHPSGRGLLIILQFAACAAWAAATAPLSRTGPRRVLTIAVCALGCAESLLALLQFSRQAPLHLHPILETSFPLWQWSLTRYGLSPDGSFPHVYLAAGFALVAAAVAAVTALSPDEPRPERWAIVTAWCLFPIAVSYSRSALLGLAAFAGCLAWLALRHPDIRARVALLGGALLAGFVVPAAIFRSQWLRRGTNSLTGAQGGVANGRTTLFHQALTVLRAHLLTGVGPGRYIFAVEHRFGLANAPKDTNGYLPVHNMPLLAATEGGVLAGVVLAAAFIWLGWRALRAGPLALGVYFTLLPYCMVDQFPYESAQGAVIMAIWLATVDFLCRHPHRWRPARAARADVASSAASPPG